MQCNLSQKQKTLSAHVEKLERTQDPAEHHICYCAERKYKSILDEENLYFGLFWLFASSKLKIFKIFNFPIKIFGIWITKILVSMVCMISICILLVRQQKTTPKRPLHEVKISETEEKSTADGLSPHHD